MREMENDQLILTLITKLFYDILEVTNPWDLPDSHAALINFSGREMQKLYANPDLMQLNRLKRKPSFTIDTLTAATIRLILHAFQIGRYVNNVRNAAGRQKVDWYQRILEEDRNERQ